jgi:hypothetical protein
VTLKLSGAVGAVVPEATETDAEDADIAPGRSGDAGSMRQPPDPQSMGVGGVYAASARWSVAFHRVDAVLRVVGDMLERLDESR